MISVVGQGITYSTTTFVNLGTLGTGPGGIVLDSAGNLFATNGNAIQEISPSGSVSLFAGDLAIAGSANGTGRAAQFNGPTGIAIDQSDNLYVADTGNNAIRKITPSGAVTTLAGFIEGDVDGVGITAEFSGPTAVAADDTGTVYVVDAGNNALRTIAADGRTKTLLLGADFSFIPTVDSQFPPSYTIRGVAADGAGNLYLAVEVSVPFGNGEFPSGTIAILRVTTAGTYTPLTGTSLPSFSPLSQFHSFGALATDKGGNVYATSANALYLVGSGQIEPAMAFQTFQASSFSFIGYPAGLVVDPLGRIYVADPGLGTVVLVTPIGQRPTITSQPQGATISFGNRATLSTSATGSAPFTYQWKLNGNNIPGATASTYAATLGGSYTAVVTNAAGSATTSPAVVTVANRLVNISSRAQVGTGADVEIAGFVISGLTGTTKQVLIRAIGPGLAQFSIPGALAQPTLTVFDSSNHVLSTNTGWNTNSNAVQIATVAANIGAFALQLNSTDSAVLLNLAPGAYTAVVSGANGSTGVALAEVYEVTDDSSQLVNISTRAMVGTGANVEIAGLVVSGTQPCNVLIRADGPALGQFGVPGLLAQPTLSVIDANGRTVATNTGWSTNSDPARIAAVAEAVGAFPLQAGSADCALIVALPPGTYTAIVSGVGDTSGVALVEVYQAPQ